MAYIIQQRRDTKEAWSKVNPTLANAELGFILDTDESGRQKSSLYKIGDGKTPWNELPLFGFGGTFYSAADAWKGSDLDTTLASQQAILNKIAEKITASETSTNTTIEEVRTALENLFNVSLTDLDKKYDTIINGTEEYVDEESGETVPATPGIEGRLSTAESKVDILLGDNTVEGSIDNRVKVAVDDAVTGILDGVSIDFDTLKEVETYIVSNKEAMNTLNETASSHTTTLGEHGESIEKHEKDVYGWTETKETPSEDPEGEPTIEEIRHKGFDEKIQDVDTKIDGVDTKIDELEDKIEAKHQILTENEYAALDKSTYPDGTIFFTYKAEPTE